MTTLSKSTINQLASNFNPENDKWDNFVEWTLYDLLNEYLPENSDYDQSFDTDEFFDINIDLVKKTIFK